ncbi:MAG: hypothetical protein H7177_10290 [Rhizobacter sp.]|nr:hypothetical protein [Bacteriovorax sp.]
MKILILTILLISLSVNAATPLVGPVQPKSIPAENSATEFFAKEAKSKEKSYRFNPYETIFSGAIAFVIGNVGFYTTKSSVLQLGYSGVQTIGIINVGHGIYDVNSPSTEGELYKFLVNDNYPGVSKERLSSKLIHIFAQEERAKRMALFYGSSLLTVQYFVNSFAGNSKSELKKIYLFMGGVNLIIATYSGLYKSNYEKKIYGTGFNIQPVFTATDKEAIAGGLITYSF